MKTESNIKPPAPFEIENLGEFADIIFYENIEPVMRDDAEHWQFHAYRLTGVRNRDGLEASIAANLAAWLEMAKKRAPEQPTDADRIAALESAMLDMILGGA